MKVLVPGGAGCIGSHTRDRLVTLGHNMIVDALTAPVHRDRKPDYLTPGVDLAVGYVRNRDLVANLLCVDVAYHFAAYPGPPPRLRRIGGEYAAWLDEMPGLDQILAEADAKIRALGVVRKTQR
jgi:nucleoside-diphosphate-sugar epimerase